MASIPRSSLYAGMMTERRCESECLGRGLVNMLDHALEMREVFRRHPLALSTSALALLAVLLWLPRLRGPLDLRYDAGVYYVLGTSLAEGKGLRLLNEPGAIQAIQYPPLLPLFAAVHQWIAASTDPAIAGHWLRLSFALLFLGYIVGIHRLARNHLSPGFAFLAALVALLHLQGTWLSDIFFAEIPFAFVTVIFRLS